MAAANTDKLRKGFYGSATTLSANIGNTDATIPLSSTVGLPTDTGIDIVIDRVDANGNKTPSKQETLTVVISGTNGTVALRGVEGSGQAHTSGAVVEILYTAATHNDSVNWGLAQHNQDGSHAAVTATSVASAGDVQIRNVSLETIRNESLSNFVVPAGGVVAQSSGFIGTFSNITYYIAGRRYTQSSIANKTYTASQDTYVDIDTSGNVTYVAVANGATTGMTLTANSVRVAKVVTNGSGITSVTQSGTDPLGNSIKPAGPVGSGNIDFSSLKSLDFPSIVSGHEVPVGQIEVSSGVYKTLYFMAWNTTIGSVQEQAIDPTYPNGPPSQIVKAQFAMGGSFLPWRTSTSNFLEWSSNSTTTRMLIMKDAGGSWSGAAATLYLWYYR